MREELSAAACAGHARAAQRWRAHASRRGARTCRVWGPAFVL